MGDLQRVSFWVSVLGASLIWLVSLGCSSTSTNGGTSDACSAACAHSASCPGAGTTTQTCLDECRGLHFTKKCTDAITSAPCSELAKGLDQSSVTPSCFATCSPDEQHCAPDDKMYICKNSLALTADCAWACSTASKSYAGVCGTTYQGQTSATDVCWCK